MVTKVPRTVEVEQARMGREGVRAVRRWEMTSLLREKAPFLGRGWGVVDFILGCEGELGRLCSFWGF